MLRILRVLFVHFIFLAPAVVVAEGRVGNESVEPRLTVGVTGSTPSAKRKNPTAILASADMQRLIPSSFPEACSKAMLIIAV